MMSEPLDVHCRECATKLPNVGDYRTNPLCPDCEARGAAVPIGVRVQLLRAEIGGHREQLARLEAELAELLAARGSRPGDGSDQPALFSVDAPGLFG